MESPLETEASNISEIFSSIQGEGVHLGERHLFIRFQDCPFHCQYCDEWGKAGDALSVDRVMEKIGRLEQERGPHVFVSLTGGEPLLYPIYIKELMKELRLAEFKVYLETSGVLWSALKEVISGCDVVAMDMKPSSVTGAENCARDHEKFLRIASKTDVFIKMVLSPEIDFSEFDELIKIVHEVRPDTTVVLQPASGIREGHENPALMCILYKLQRRAMGKIEDVRIIPRLQKILNLP